ncbi:MAG: M23 family metallopeptidase [Pseudomonadota bacterium]
MSSASIREPASFGRRATPHKVVVTTNGKTRQFDVHPLFMSFAAATVFMFLVGYFGATAYLIFRDDLISASYTNQARMQHEYEDRIAALRSKLDRITSRQLLDQKAIEMQVEQLLARQSVIGDRSGKMSALLSAANELGLDAQAATGKVPIPVISPAKSDGNVPAKAEDHAALDTINTSSVKPILGSSSQSTTKLKTGRLSAQPSSSDVALRMGTSFTKQLFGDMAKAIGVIDTKQRQQIETIRQSAIQRTAAITDTLKSFGVSPKKIDVQHNVGGPFVPLDSEITFENHLEALEESLFMYDTAKDTANGVPLGRPLKGGQVSSRYGKRKDPFNGRIAMHGGIDFRASRGTPVLASGDGKIVKAGRNGGYGKVVEIRHSNGYTSRYAHLSRISVKNGQKVKSGQIIGKVGSTGRSTGPHLHYEVRRNDKTHDPARFLNGGRKIKDML